MAEHRLDVDEFVSLSDLEKGCITSLANNGSLQWMGAVRMRVQTADKNIVIITSKAGCTLEDFKANLHPWTIGRCGPIRLLCVSLWLFNCSRLSRSTRTQIWLMIWMPLMIPAIANESEQASLTGCCVLLSWNLAATKMPRKQNTSSIFFVILFFTVKQNACQESQLTMSIVLFVILSHVWSRESPWDHVLLWIWFLQSTSVWWSLVWLNCQVCAFRWLYKAKNRLKRSSCVWSPMVLKSVKV